MKWKNFFISIRNASNYANIKNSNLKKESSLPEYVYAGQNIKPHTRIYVMGVATHGALGIKSFHRPGVGKRIYKFMQRPCRLLFADIHKVDDIGCGYGFSILGVKGNPAFFGSGVADNCQIGYHATRTGHPLDILIEPHQIDIPLQNKCQSKKIACGRAHTMIWTDTDGLWTFGNNSYGQCGRPVIENECYQSKPWYQNIKMFNGKNIDQIECGQDSSFVLRNGKLYSCGWSADGQTGRGTYKNVEAFECIEGDLKGENVIKISSKADCVLALTDKGDVFGWGNSEYRQLGSVTEEQQINIPRKLKLNLEGKIIDIAAAGTACFALTDIGDIWSWGYGILGTGPAVHHSFEPTLIPSTLLGRTILNKDSKIMKIFAGVTFAAAVTNEGGLYAWGRNIGGCLGLGHTNFQHFPMRVCVSSSVVKVSCGVDHMLVMAKSLM